MKWMKLRIILSYPLSNSYTVWLNRLNYFNFILNYISFSPHREASEASNVVEKTFTDLIHGVVIN